MSIAIRDVLSREEMAALCRKSDLRGAWAILQVWLCIAATFALLAAYPNPLTFLLAVFILGGQQLACAVLTHEAAHYTLFKTRWMNEVVTGVCQGTCPRSHAASWSGISCSTG